VPRELVDAVADLGLRLGHEVRRQAPVGRRQLAPPSSVASTPPAEIATSIRAGSVGCGRIVCRHRPPAPGAHWGPTRGCAGRRAPTTTAPRRSCGTARRPRRRRAPCRGRGRRREGPHPGELPRQSGRAVVVQVRAGLGRVGEVVADRLPGDAPVVGALDHLPEPAVGLRRVEPVGIRRGSGDVVDLPTAEQRRRHLPGAPPHVRGQDERALHRPTSTRTPRIASPSPRSPPCPAGAASVRRPRWPAVGVTHGPPLTGWTGARPGTHRWRRDPTLNLAPSARNPPRRAGPRIPRVPGRPCLTQE
jgi:hypothetical protein